MKKILLIYKKSAFETHFNFKMPGVKKAKKSCLEDEGLRQIKRSHEIHYETLRSIEAYLKDKRTAYDLCPRGERFNPRKYELFISVGGDGTFLEVAKYLTDQPIVGVNSDPARSVGKFCSCNKTNFRDYFEKALTKPKFIRKLHRLEIFLNKKNPGIYILNDILICHSNPAAMSHYVLTVGSRSERQKSSGIWIATASGSTGGIHSAGGKKMSGQSKHIQYLPRELYEGYGTDYKLRGGQLASGDNLGVISQMQEGVIYLDGPHHPLIFNYGSHLEVFQSRHPLRVFLK